MPQSDFWASLGLDYKGFTKSVQAATGMASKAFNQMAHQISASTTSSFGQMNKEATNFATRTANQMKDISRIVQGILVSQGFYQMARGFREVTAGIVDMHMVLEDANTAFTHFLGNADAASAYLDKLQDFAAVTPFKLEESISAANRLLAVGFEAGKIIPIMRRVTDATAALGGSPETYESIIATLSKIQTTGRITARDVNSLARQGVNASKYLREELQLTSAELRQIGKMDIPAEVAINTILNGMGEFAGLSQDLSKNLRGLMSTFTDDIQILGILISKNLFDKVSEGFEHVTETLSEMVQITRDLGVGGLFERLIPPEIQSQVRVIGAVIKDMINSMMTFGKAIMTIFGTTLKQLAQVASLILPPFARLMAIFADLSYYLITTIGPLKDILAAIVALFVIQKIGFVFLTFIAIMKKMQIVLFVGEWLGILTAAVKGLYLAFMTNPWVAAITAIVAILIYFASKLEVVQRAVGNVTASIAALLGYKITSIWTPDPKDSKRWEDYLKNTNEGLQEVEEDFEDAGDAADKAKKKELGFLAAFDEIFQVPDKKDDGGSGKDKDKDKGKGDFPPVEFVGDPEPSKAETDFVWDKVDNLWDKLKDFLDKMPKLEFPPFIFPPMPPFPPLPMPVPIPETAFAFAFEPAFAYALEKARAWAFNFGKAFEGIPGVLQRIMELIMELLFGMEAQWTKAFNLADAMKGLFTNPFNLGPLREGIGELGGLWDDFVEMMKNWGTTTWDLGVNWGLGLAGGLGLGLAGVRKALEGVVDDFLEFFKKCNNTFHEFDEQFNQGVITAINGVLLSIGSFFVTAGQSVVTGLGEMKTSWDTYIGEMQVAISTYALDVLTAVGGMFVSAGDLVSQGLEKVKNFWEEHKNTILTIVGALVLGVLGVFAAMALGVETAVVGLASIVIALFVGVKDSFADSGEQIKDNTINVFEQMRIGVSEKWWSLQDTAVTAWNNIGKTIKDAINGIIENINRLIDSWNKLSFDIPTVKLPGGGSVGGGNIGVPRIPRIPHLARGGIVREDTIARIGEGNSQEAVIPLNENSLRPLATMIANMLGQRPSNPTTGTPGGGVTGSNPTQIVFMATDDRSLKELARKLEVTQINIDRGRG